MTQRTNPAKAAARPAAPPEATAPATEAAPGAAIVHAPLRDHPFIQASLALAASLTALARFGSFPVPASLTDRVDVAQRDLVAAAADIDQGFFSPELTQIVGEPADQDWIREEFEKLAEGLKAKFEEIDGTITSRIEAATEALLAKVDERVAAASEALDAKIAAIPAAAPPAEPAAADASKA